MEDQAPVALTFKERLTRWATALTRAIQAQAAETKKPASDEWTLESKIVGWIFGIIVWSLAAVGGVIESVRCVAASVVCLGLVLRFEADAENERIGLSRGATELPPPDADAGDEPPR